MIPKIIWQTHEWDYEDLPIYFAKTSMTWINLNPEYKYIYVTGKEREEFIKLEYPEIYPYYKYMGVIDKRYESDIWRYLVLNKRGGFYCDMDSICTKPLNYVLKKIENNHEIITLSPVEESNQDGFVANINYPQLTSMNQKDITNNSNFGSIPKSKFLKGIVEHMQNDGKRIMFIEKLDEFHIYRRILEGLFTTWDLFNIELSKNLNIRVIDDFAFHSSNFKKDFINTAIIDYYGEKIPYLELLEKEQIKEVYPNRSLKEIKRITSSRKNKYANMFS
jgi:hypothetical protein